jgi:hypothetical protein
MQGCGTCIPLFHAQPMGTWAYIYIIDLKMSGQESRTKIGTTTPRGQIKIIMDSVFLETSI